MIEAGGKKIRVRIQFMVWLPVLLLAIAGCEGGSKKTTEPTPAPSTISEVIAALQRSYVEMKYDDYASLFESSYAFVFAPQDIGEGNPETWGLADELLSARHMFSKTDANADGNIAEKVTLTFDIGPEVPNDVEGWTKVILSNVWLILETHNAQTGDNTNYVVEGDQEYLWFKKVGDAWRIVQWEDKPITGKQQGSAGLTQTTSWGSIKSSYF